MGNRVVSDAGIGRHLVAARIRSDWQYRTSFLTFMTAQALVTTLELAALLLLLELTPQLGGWERTEVIFLYGLASVPFTFSGFVLGAIDRTGQYVKSGDFDRILLRPAPAMLQISALEFELRRVGKMIPDLVVLVWAVVKVDFDWSVSDAVYLAMALLGGFGIYSSLWIATSAFTFWTVDSAEATNAVTYGGHQAATFPLHIYPGWIQGALGWVVPLAFVAYVPTVHVLEAPNPLGLPDWFAYLPLPVAVVAMGLSLLIWRSGIRHYQSTGS